MRQRLVNLLPDSWYLRLAYRRAHRHSLNLRHPRTFNEKIQWCKLYYRDPLLTRLTDKYEVRQHVVDQGFPGILNELYGVYDWVDDIDFASLPNSFVIKATHGSNMNLICRNKGNLEWQTCRTLLKKWARKNYFFHGREWAYKDIKPRFVCEKYLENQEFHELTDFKFYCFNGKPELFFICTDRFSDSGVKYEAFDLDWNKIDLHKGKPTSRLAVREPGNFPEMKVIATRLCQGFPFVRVDLYSVNNRTIFGELTFYPDCGMIPFTPDQYNDRFGDLLVLPDKMP